MSEAPRDKWQFYQGPGGHWRWRKVNPSGEVVARSEEGFETKRQAVEDAALCGWRADQPTEHIE